MSFSQTFALSTTAAPGVGYIFIHVVKALPDAEIDVQPICMRRIFELLSVELGRTQYIRLEMTGRRLSHARAFPDAINWERFPFHFGNALVA